ncbi:uncharacterized protein MONBRDRAFT_23803 [Monosiga brevicollis MX1]|uniref:Uncharacterized protein n=1 Tax=Monosiga brevicollis TaxID=81824 RepID=A9UUV9_MONBE|nr:uncharacterized protein MONBRDRAFT_23803 [Monosiga brevicollis MX1]EDQ90786.1 predicted protein [Monosiga brevicollis MX1]|eukprot:XP_001744083.1 hypothetical protein [Monosiga brevicollis MX1]
MVSNRSCLRVVALILGLAMAVVAQQTARLDNGYDPNPNPQGWRGKEVVWQQAWVRGLKTAQVLSKTRDVTGSLPGEPRKRGAPRGSLQPRHEEKRRDSTRKDELFDASGRGNRHSKTERPDARASYARDRSERRNDRSAGADYARDRSKRRNDRSAAGADYARDRSKRRNDRSAAGADYARDRSERRNDRSAAGADYARDRSERRDKPDRRIHRDAVENTANYWNAAFKQFGDQYKNLSAWDRGEAHRRATEDLNELLSKFNRRKEVKLNIGVYNHLLRAYGIVGDAATAVEMFKLLVQRSTPVDTYSLSAAYLAVQRSLAPLRHLSQSELSTYFDGSERPERPRHTATAAATPTQAPTDLHVLLEQLQSCHDLSLEKDLPRNKFTYNALLQALLSCRAHGGMVQVFNDMTSEHGRWAAESRPDAVTYSLMLRAFLETGERARAQQLLKIAKLECGHDLGLHRLVVLDAARDQLLKSGSASAQQHAFGVLGVLCEELRQRAHAVHRAERLPLARAVSQLLHNRAERDTAAFIQQFELFSSSILKNPNLDLDLSWHRQFVYRLLRDGARLKTATLPFPALLQSLRRSCAKLHQHRGAPALDSLFERVKADPKVLTSVHHDEWAQNPWEVAKTLDDPLQSLHALARQKTHVRSREWSPAIRQACRRYAHSEEVDAGSLQPVLNYLEACPPEMPKRLMEDVCSYINWAMHFRPNAMFLERVGQIVGPLRGSEVGMVNSADAPREWRQHRIQVESRDTDEVQVATVPVHNHLLQRQTSKLAPYKLWAQAERQASARFHFKRNNEWRSALGMAMLNIQRARADDCGGRS